MSALALPGIRQRTPEWIEERRHHLGSSDAPVLAGERGSLYGLWAEKTSRADPSFDDDTVELMQIGEFLEPALRALYVERQRRPIRARHVTHYRRDWPVASASLDAESGRRIVETKWSNSAEWFRAVAAGSTESVPGKVMAQCQWQMFVLGRDVADVAILLGRTFRVIEIERDDAYIADLEYVGRWLWEYVLADEPPEVDGSEETREAITRVHPRDNGTWLAPTPTLEALVREYRDASAAKKAAELVYGTAGNAIRAVLGDASGILGLLSWKNNAPSEKPEWEDVARAAVADLAAELDMADPEPLLARYVGQATSLRAGARTIHLLKGGKAL